MPPRSRLLATLALACATLGLGLLWMDSRSDALGHAGHDLSSRLTDVTRTADTGRRLVLPGSPDAENERQAPQSRDEAWAAAEIAARTASIEIVVRARGTGRPIPGAFAWVVDSSFRRKQCDDSGRVTFAVLPGKTLVGGEPPRPSEYIELAYDPDTDEPAAETDVTLVSDEHDSVDVTLFPAAAIRGRVTDAKGEPRARFGFMLLPKTGNRWGRFRRVWTDEAGRFSVRLLERGTYIIGPDPDRGDVFPIVESKLEWGETKEFELKLAAAKVTTIRVEVLQEVTDEPWPFPFGIDVVRDDGLGDRGRSRSRDELLVAHGPSPLVHRFHARPGPYRVSASFAPATRGNKIWIVEEWHAEEVVEVTDEFADLEVQLAAPKLGQIAHVEGYLSRDFADFGSGLHIRFAGDDSMDHVVYPRGGDRRFDIWVDLALASSNELEFIELRAGRETKLATVSILEGTQQVSITPRAD